MAVDRFVDNPKCDALFRAVDPETGVGKDAGVLMDSELLGLTSHQLVVYVMWHTVRWRIYPVDVYSKTFSFEYGISYGKHELYLRTSFCNCIFA